ncbi:MAG: hypothetical protein ACP5N1_05870 [Candidatus Woesearchaeota archaeon]
MNAYLSRKKNMKETIEHYIKEQKETETKISDLKEKLNEFENIYTSLGEDLIQKIEKINNQNATITIPGAYLGGVIGSVLGIYSCYYIENVINNNSINPYYNLCYIPGLVLGGIGLITGFVLGKRKVKTNVKKLIEKYPEHSNQISTYYTKINS